VQLDLNDPDDLTLDRVKELIASVDDSCHRQLRVSTGGIAYISDEIGNINIDGLAFRFETWLQGNGYVGAAAAQDAAWVNKIYTRLRENWPKPKDTFIDW